MGTWGTGNFESDNALNTFADWVNQIVARIREVFTYDNQNSLYQASGEGDIVANVDILGTLYEQYHFNSDLEISEIRKWKADYLATFDRISAIYTQFQEAIEFNKQRRVVIENTFDRLIGIIEKLEEDAGDILGE